MMGTASRERRVGRAWSALDDTARRRPAWLMRATGFRSSPSEEEERTWNARPGASEEAQKRMNPMTCRLSPFDKLRTTLVEARIECPSTGSGHSLG